jgi:hypothetical protein
MADRAISTEFWKIRSEAPGIAEPLLHARYVETLKDFFHRTRAWRWDTGILPISANQTWPTTSNVTPAHTYIVEPVAVTWVPTGLNIPFKARDQLDRQVSNWQDETAGGPTWWTKLNLGEYALVPRPVTAYTNAIRLRLAISVQPSVQAIPEELLNEFSEEITAGVLMNVLKMPGKDWSDPQMAGVYSSSYEQGIKAAKSRADADYGRPTRVVAYGGI